MLEGMKILYRADERNEGKFRDVKQFLLEEVARKARNPTKESRAGRNAAQTFADPASNNPG